jgi:hypothetical protein
MIIDTSFLQEFYHAEKIEKYDDLINYMKRFDNKYYNSLNIKTELHHIIPAYECEDLDTSPTIYLPIPIHFKAHILRARETKFQSIKAGNYTEAIIIVNRYKTFVPNYKEFNEARKYYMKWSKPKSFEAAFGIKKANRIKKMISNSMKNLDTEIISKRNERISKYASQRPQSHNDAISKGRTKMVYEITGGKYYANVNEASTILNVSVSSIRNCCNGRVKTVKSYQFEYF